MRSKQPIPRWSVLSLLATIFCLVPGTVSLRGQDPSAPAAESAAAPQGAGSAEVVLTVGDREIRAAEFEKILAHLPPQFEEVVSKLGKRGFANQYGNMLALALEGENRNVDEGEEFSQMLAFQRWMLLAQLTLDDLASSLGEITPQDVAGYYADNRSEFEQAKVRGIYIPFQPEDDSEQPAAAEAALTEAEALRKAEDLRSRIQAGEDMAALAEQESDHPTASNGGDFGYVRHRQFAAQIDEAIFEIPLNEVSDPVRDRFGYFLFQVEDKQVRPIEEVRTSIENGLRQRKLGEVLAEVRADYPVTLNSDYFAEPASPVPAVPSR